MFACGKHKVWSLSNKKPACENFTYINFIIRVNIGRITGELLVSLHTVDGHRSKEEIPDSDSE